MSNLKSNCSGHYWEPLVLPVTPQCVLPDIIGIEIVEEQILINDPPITEVKLQPMPKLCIKCGKYDE